MKIRCDHSKSSLTDALNCSDVDRLIHMVRRNHIEKSFTKVSQTMEAIANECETLQDLMFCMFVLGGATERMKQIDSDRLTGLLSRLN